MDLYLALALMYQAEKLIPLTFDITYKVECAKMFTTNFGRHNHDI